MNNNKNTINNNHLSPVLTFGTSAIVTCSKQCLPALLLRNSHHYTLKALMICPPVIRSLSRDFLGALHPEITLDNEAFVNSGERENLL